MLFEGCRFMSSCATTVGTNSLAPVSGVLRWILATVMLATIALGWKWPVLGFVVPITMTVGIVGAFFRGRYSCGNICPRGSFYDTLFRLVGGTRPTPAFLSNMTFRWLTAAILMTAITVQVAQNPSDPLHWGRVFWLACAVTTAVGVVLGYFYRPRTWCSFCPVGTMANAIGGHKDKLKISAKCKSCGICETSCPMDICITQYKSEGVLDSRDCLKCSSCVNSCKVGALSFEN